MIDTATLPALPDSKYYMFELPGVQLTEATLGPIGTLTEVYDLPAHPVGAFEFKGTEVMFPIHEHTILKFDRKNNTLHIQLPEGLLEVYTNPSEKNDGDEAN
jgi:16S rRNA processing protein RimM